MSQTSTAQIVIIGYSNVALRLAYRLSQSQCAVRFYISKTEADLVYHPPASLELAYLPRLSPHYLPDSVSTANTVILASDDEAFNLHATMHLKSLYPELKILTRSFNLAIGQEIEKRLSDVKVFSVSARSAPYFAAAAFYDEIALAWQEDQKLWISQFASNSEAIQVKADTFRNRLLKPQKPKRVRVHKHRPDYVLLSVLCGILAVIASGSVYFWQLHHLPLGDAIYFVVTTLTTTGYGDYSLKDFPFYSKLVGMSLMLAGASLFAILFALITDKLFQARLDALLGHRHVRYSGHVVLCGAGDIGFRVLENLLLTGAKVVVIERNPEARFNQQIRELGVPLIIADATLDETLLQAACDRAQSIICATDQDLFNLSIALTARSLNPDIRIVARVYDDDFASEMRQHFGLDIALSSSAIAAQSLFESTLKQQDASASQTDHFKK